MRTTASSFALAVLMAGTAAGVAAPAQAAQRAADPYAHTRLERVWAPKVCLSMGGSKKNNARLVVGKCAKTDKTQRWTMKRLSGNKSLLTIKNDKSGKCLNVGSKSRLVQSTCKASAKSQQWALSGSLIISKSKGKAIASNSTKSGSKPYLETRHSSPSDKERVRQEWGLS
ncbi:MULTISPECIES: RICIN domain-containing protein [unclassified Streptomyces]|uniref:RICIN domain-containing protein n=1 Tax=unclassified Streptomyces TaxID=2593676 RepID=UPI002E2C01B6|nr:ricin-type beta-trefoil lectin domain protein [Streptomyces sp. NBC_01429]